ncbi:MAG: glutamate--tRNA ligase [Candidatus Nitrospinota bacterium M3_3B_026]
MVRTRFAPSPTGYLHIGGARTAIFNWLYARRHDGIFVLRIEDTDRERSTEDSIAQIIESMKWLGMDHDEGPYRQTERQDIYREYIDRLLAEGKAYRCVCPKEELERKREQLLKAGKKPKYDGTCRNKNIPADIGEPYVVRFATPLSGVTAVEDLLRGYIRFDNEQLDDMIIARADGTPTYNFCVVVDDAEMKITHVIRGDDHLANTPRQAVIYDALGIEPPKFAHVSMILGPDGKRLSKRHGALSVLEYRDRGILPSALFNYLVRLGWSHGDREVFTIAELAELFDLDAVTKSAASFNEEKLIWLNAEHIKMAPEDQLSALAEEFLKKRNIEADEAGIKPLLPMLRQRARTAEELAAGMVCFFTDRVEYDEKAAKKFLKPEIAPVLKELAERLEKVDFGSGEDIEKEFRALLDEKGLKLKNLAQPTRVALTGGTVSPGLFEVMAAMGREKCLALIRSAAEYAGAGAGR